MNRRSFAQTLFGAGTAAAVNVGTVAGRQLPGDQNEQGIREILLYSGWATKNIGDIGHTPGTLRRLEEHLPNVARTLWIRRTNAQVSTMLRSRFPDLRIVQGRLDEAGKASTPELQQAFDACDLFLFNSGMHFNQFWKPPTGVLDACFARQKKIALFGQSFDGFAAEDEQYMAKLLSRTAFISTRDNQSFYYLRSIDAKPPFLAFGPDGCFGIDVRNDERANAFLEASKLTRGEYITVTIRTNTPPLSKQTGNVLNPIEPSKQEKEQDDLWASKIRGVVTHWVRQTGLKVLLAPEVDKEMPSAKRLIFDRLDDEIKSSVVHRDVFWNVDEAASVYRQARAVVSMEPHSCIIALANGTPALHLFSKKHGVKAWMFRDIGLPEWLHDIDTDPTARLCATLDQIHSRYPLAESKVNRAMALVNQIMAEQMSVIGNITRH